ncbi:phosphomannomutase [Candidatus Nanopelagicus hibericus]|uniref:Phosphomannomutase n=1 Tax=Candidatus Nanopelagicus hibericus TaxID=1884915 RepID=A0A249K8C6_9ACTN|nr:phosphomannomutase/phosphoglucomutase [Candidatus Nanopelagicus hibericus]ASY12979.1 phosphomannomutase [Candidatus Nanopelagicus hibericus]
MLEKIIKAYDIRGLVKNEITPDFSFSLGVAFAKFLEIEREPATIVVGEDMRPSSAPLAAAFSDGATSQGMDVIRIGLASTDMLYFASGKLNLPGIMFTASHNPAKYNGMKLCKSGARPIGQESGLLKIRQFIEDGVPISNRPVGSVRNQDLLSEYVEYLLARFPKKTFKKRKLKVVIDAGNGMAGFTAPAVMKHLNIDLVPMYFELDGNFPNHEANPIESDNLKDLQKKVKKEKADIGLAFDGDADRCFLIDEKGDLVNPSALTALIAARELKSKPGSTIIYNLISSKAVAEVIAENGGVALRSRVGHSYIKSLMAESGAIFGGEHSGHFYFADFWRADSGMLAALYALAELMESSKPLSNLLQPYNRYFSSGEINSKVKDVAKSIKAVRAEYQDKYQLDELDGLTVTADTWWFNLRPSNTEPLLRLNVEANTEKEMASITDTVLALL